MSLSLTGQNRVARQMSREVTVQATGNELLLVYRLASWFRLAFSRAARDRRPRGRLTRKAGHHDSSVSHLAKSSP